MYQNSLTATTSSIIGGFDVQPSAANDAGNGFLPETFWNARPLFGQIRAHARRLVAAPDATLFICLARTAALWPACVGVSTGVKTARPPILFVGVVGNSGAGKTTSRDAAVDLIPRQVDIPDMMPLGSGQGVCETFMGFEDDKDAGRNDVKRSTKKKQIHYNAFFVCDEGETLNRLASGSDAILSEVLRELWNGTPIGQTNAHQQNTRLASNYTAGLVANFVPEAAQALVRQVGFGSPQRWLWCWAWDPGAQVDAPPAVVPKLRTSPPDPIGDITFCAPVRLEIRRLIVDQTAGRKRVEPLDAHALYVRCRIAAILCVWDARQVVNEEDWQLADVLWHTSCQVRAALLTALRAIEEARERARIDARIRQTTEIKLATADADKQVRRHAERIAAFVGERGPVRNKDIQIGLFNSRSRGFCEKALARAHEFGWIEKNEAGQWVAGPKAPKSQKSE